MRYMPRNRRRQPTALDLYEQRHIARGAYFTACAFLGIGVYDTRRLRLWPILAQLGVGLHHGCTE
jgi:hypothetical protein